MVAYHKVEVSLNTNAVEVGIPSPQSVTVTVPTVGPVGPQGPAGPKGDPGEVSGSIAWDNVTDKPSTFTPSSHTHNGDEVYLGEDGDPQPVRLTGFADSGINGNYWPQDITINSKPVYKKNKSYGLFYENDTWHVFDTVPITANIIESSDNDSASFPQDAAAWSGTVELANVGNFSKDAAQQFVFVGDNIPSTQVTGLSIPTASSATPSALGVAATGSSNDFARADHVHGMPDVEDLANVSVPSAPNTDDVLAYDQDSSAWVNKDFATLASENIGPADIGAAPASGIDPTAITGTAVVDSDARLSDPRTPSSHASSHAAAGSDPLAPSDIGLGSGDTVQFYALSLGLLSGDSGSIDFQTGTAEFQDENGGRVFAWSTTALDVEKPIAFTGANAATNAATTRTNLGLGDSATADIGAGSTEVAAGDHGHGNINSSGQVGTTANLPLKTGTGGIVEAGVFGTGAGEFAEGNHSHELTALAATGATNGHVLTADGAGGVTFAAASGGGVTAVGASTADVLSVSGSDLVADDGGTIDSSDPFIKWDDLAGKLVYANPLSRPSGAFYVGLAPTTTALGSNAINFQATRTNAADVASGSASICIGTGGNRASGQESISIGTGNLVSGLRATGIGLANTASGQESIALGSLGFASGVKSVGVNETAVLRGQVSLLPFRAVYWGGQTTDATPLILNLDATATNRFTIAANTALAVDILLVARRSDTADKWLVARRFLGIRRDGSNNTSLIGSVQTLGTDQTDGSPTWSFTLTADDTNEALQLEVTGAASETVQWRATAFYRFV